MFVLGGGSEHIVVTQNSTSTSERPVLPLAHEIPESLLAHDDVISPEKQKQQQIQTEKGNVKETHEKVSEDDHKSFEEVQQVDKTTGVPEKDEQNEKTGENKEKSGQMSSPIRTVEVQKDKSETQNQERRSLRSTKPLVSTEDSTVDHGKVKTRNTIKSKKELEKELRSVKTLKEISKRVKSPSKQVRPVVNVEVSPRRPRRTSQLPARLAESEVFIKRKRTSSSLGDSSTEAKKIKNDDNKKEVTENSSMTVGSSQESEKPTSSADSSPTKLQKKRKSNKEKSQGTETVDNSENEKPKSKPEKTLPCPVCKQLMREWENVFDHVKKQHSNHPEHEFHLTDLKVRFFCILIQQIFWYILY